MPPTPEEIRQEFVQVCISELPDNRDRYDGKVTTLDGSSPVYLDYLPARLLGDMAGAFSGTLREFQEYGISREALVRSWIENPSVLDDLAESLTEQPKEWS